MQYFIFAPTTSRKIVACTMITVFSGWEMSVTVSVWCESLWASHPLAARCRVYVVDLGSNDGTLEWLLNYCSPLATQNGAPTFFGWTSLEDLKVCRIACRNIFGLSCFKRTWDRVIVEGYDQTTAFHRTIEILEASVTWMTTRINDSNGSKLWYCEKWGFLSNTVELLDHI